MVEKKLNIGDLVLHAVDFEAEDGGGLWGRGLGIIISFDEDDDPVIYFVETGSSARCYWAEIKGIKHNDE